MAQEMDVGEVMALEKVAREVERGYVPAPSPVFPAASALSSRSTGVDAAGRGTRQTRSANDRGRRYTRRGAIINCSPSDDLPGRAGGSFRPRLLDRTMSRHRNDSNLPLIPRGSLTATLTAPLMPHPGRPREEGRASVSHRRIIGLRRRPQTG
jgi:hypothetical protein